MASFKGPPLDSLRVSMILTDKRTGHRFRGIDVLASPAAGATITLRSSMHI